MEFLFYFLHPYNFCFYHGNLIRWFLVKCCAPIQCSLSTHVRTPDTSQPDALVSFVIHKIWIRNNCIFTYILLNKPCQIFPSVQVRCTTTVGLIVFKTNLLHTDYQVTSNIPPPPLRKIPSMPLIVRPATWYLYCLDNVSGPLNVG